MNLNLKQKKVKPLDAESELIKVTNDIKSYLEKVEFYFEEPDANKLTTLQNKRTELELIIKKNRSKNTHTNSKNNDLQNIFKKIHYLETQIEGLKSKLNKEKQLRVNLHTRVQIYRQEILRCLYESHKDLNNINWIKSMIEKNPNWGITKHSENK